MNKPVLFCYDGSDGSKTALRAVVDMIKPGDAVVLVVWMPASVQLARAGSFIVSVPNEGEIDEQEAKIAQRIAEEGAESARTHGYNALSANRSGERIGGEDDRGRSPRRSTPA